MANFLKPSVRITRALPWNRFYGAITFYLGAKEEVEADIAERERVEEEFTETHPAPADLKQKLERARQQLLSRQP